MEINIEKALKRWTPVLENLNIKDAEKQMWVAEYADLHTINENAYNNQSNIAGMGNVVTAQPFGVGQTVGTAGVYKGSGDYGQQLLPVAMKVAAQTIGMDLVPVKPSAGPRVDLMYIDFRYDDMNLGGDEKPQMFMVKCDQQTAVNLFFRDGIGTYLATETVSGLTKRIWVNISGTNTVTANDVEPTAASKANVLEFLGFSRINGYPMFRAYRQPNTASSGAWTFDATKNSFGATASIATVVAQGFEAFVGGAGTSAADTTALTGVDIQLISALEDHIAGFVANFDSFKSPMTRGTHETTYPGNIGPEVFSKTIQMGSIEVSTGIKRTEMQDIKANLGINILDKMESILVNELSQTISKHIVSKVYEMGYLNRASAPAHVTAGIPDGSIFDYDVQAHVAASPGGETTHAIQRKLISKIMLASNYLVTEGRIGPAQYVVTNGRLAAAIADIAGYTVNPFASKINAPGQLYPVGNIGGGIAVYVDPNQKFSNNEVLVGRKNSADQPGIVFVPYMMAQSVNFISEGLNGGTKLIMTSRYAVAELGFFPQKQYLICKIHDPNTYLA